MKKFSCCRSCHGHLLPLMGMALLFLAQPVFAQQAAARKSKATDQVIANFDSKGRQLTRFSTLGDAIDAHDGEIALFNGVYYLYGTSYDCGFEWGNKNAPFCGFKVYASADMVNWTDRGFLFNAATAVWQSRCNGSTYGCFRPHVVYNKKTKLYVLWINVYDNVSGYRVFTSKKPTGPFTEAAEPVLSVNNSAPAAGLNNGDHDTFIDDDGTAYLAFTDWRTNGTIVIEKLSADYLTGTGEVATAITAGKTEAPGMFKRNGIYYVVYSDPNCGYCSGTGASYKTARAPLGPWSDGKKISDNSCGGQPSFMSTIKLGTDTVYLFGSDLWNNAAKNEALANYFWAPLSFAPDGAILPIDCRQPLSMPAMNSPAARTLPDSFMIHPDTGRYIRRIQSFTAKSTGVLSSLSVAAYKTGIPDAGLAISLFKADEAGQPMGNAVSRQVIPAGRIGWSVKMLSVQPKLSVIKNNRYCILLESATSTGHYSFAFRETASAAGITGTGNDGSRGFAIEPHKEIKFKVTIDK